MTIHEPGRRLRRVRERLRLKYRDVAEASERIARRHEDDEYIVGLSRLADIENKGTVPSIFRLYSLSAIYALDLHSVLSWYGVDVQQLPLDSVRLELDETHLAEFGVPGETRVTLPAEFATAVDFRKTVYLSQQVQRWGSLPLLLLNGLDVQRHRYAFIGVDDWSMYPLLMPGSFVQIDESRSKVVNSGWAHELERPIYLIEHRSGFRCGWCTVLDGKLILQPHSASPAPPEIYNYPEEADVVGQVVAVAMRLDPGKRRRTRS